MNIRCWCCKRDFDDPLLAPISALGLDTRSHNRLETYMELKTVGELVDYTPRQLIAVSGLAKKTLADIKNRLAFYGLSLKEER